MRSIKAYFKEHTNPPVFLSSLLMLAILVSWGVSAPTQLGDAADALKNSIVDYFGWWYLLSVFGFLIFVVILMFSPFGRVRLGKDDDRPSWSRLAWFSMLFTAGMGIGLVFYGVAEPISHFQNLPPSLKETGPDAFRALHVTFFHWGLHPWAVYIVLGLSIGYFSFRHDLPLRPASALYPLIGNRINGWIGHLIDILAVFGTLFGLATSLGLGATQINAGLYEVFGIPQGWPSQVLIIAIITCVAVVSLMLGLNRGIRRLSLINLSGAAILALAVLISGPTLFILNLLVQSMGNYLQNLPWISLRSFAFSSEGRDWLESWTLFYWGWWIAWSPFVGIFLARVSRGRTIREFIIGTLLVPVAASISWFCIVGGTALYIIINENSSALRQAGESDALFILLQQLPLPELGIAILSALAIFVVAIFFATSSDSGSLVVDMLTNGGDPNPIWQQRMFWAVTEGVVAAILLVAGTLSTSGDPLGALQTAAITSGLPFSVVLLLMCWALIRQLRQEPYLQPARPVKK